MKQTSDLPCAAGIYLLTHNVTGDTYVGSAINIRGRFASHMADLRGGRHINRKMSAIALEHGIDFTCSVLRLTGTEKRFVHERASIEELRPTLNKMMPPTKEREDVGRASAPMSVRIDDALIEAANSYADAFEERHNVRPSLSQIIRAALMDYLPRRHAELAKPPAKKRGQ